MRIRKHPFPFGSCRVRERQIDQLAGVGHCSAWHIRILFVFSFGQTQSILSPGRIVAGDNVVVTSKNLHQNRINKFISCSKRQWNINYIRKAYIGPKRH